MRKFAALVGALVLALSVAAPVAAQGEGPYVNGITITSITVNKAGTVDIQGTLYCQYMGSGSQFNVQGSLTENMGHKGTVTANSWGNGQFWGDGQCADTGPTYWSVQAVAYPGMFGPGWASVQLNFGMNNCDPSGCWWQDYGQLNTYVKVTKK